MYNFPELQSGDLLALFKKLINNIIGDVRTRLIHDAKKEGLIICSLIEPENK